MSNRDDFSEKTKKAVATRAGWHCSLTGCGKLTVGPSEESSAATSNIGVAAHISAAAPGPGARRYIATMTSEERASVDNAIWLCADHATLIDRDEATYTVEKLNAMKREHERACAQALRSGSSLDWGTGLLAVSPDVVCTGGIDQVSANSWTLRLRHFVIGDIHRLIFFINGFAKAKAEDKYILSSELGDGRVLTQAPSLTKQSDGYSLVCPVAPSFPRTDAQKLGGGIPLHPETGYVNEKGDIALVAGLEYLPQKVRTLLSMQRGENVFSPSAGVRFFEYFEAFKGTPWISLLMTLDVVRQAAIPFTDGITKQQYTPLQCVTRVRSVELLSETPTNHMLPVRLDFDVQGVGQWQREIGVYMPTEEQMAERAQLIAEMAPLFQIGS